MTMPNAGGQTPNEGPAAAYTVPWARLRAWIDDKERWEMQHRQPAPLSDQQLAAISQLVAFGSDEPSVGDQDYISNLMRYVQVQRLSPPTWSEDRVPTMVDGRPQVKWRCFCSLIDLNGKFPREGYGVVRGGEVPSFQNKKKAKQYAAKQLLRFIESVTPAPPNSNSNSNGGAPLEPPSTPSSKRLRLSQNSTPVPSPPSPSPSSSLSPSSRRRNGSNPLGAVGDRDPTIFECVRRLAEELGIENPTYSLAPTSDDLPEFFSGRAVFRAGSKVPDDVGVVRSVLGRRNAQVQAAQGVLVWLQGEKKRREDHLAFLQGFQGLNSRS